MNIGIDFDGVVFDSENMFHTYAQLFNLKLGEREEISANEIKCQKRFNWTKEEFKQYCDECMIEIEENAPVMPYTKKVLKALSKNNNLYAITARGVLDKKEIDITLKRLKKEGIEFKDIEFCVWDKLPICQKFNIDLMIEDNYDNVKSLAENGIKCLYYRDLVLKFHDHKNVTEVHNWGDIAVELHKLGVLDVEDLKD